MPHPSAGPAILKKRLGEELRRLRDAAGIAVPQVASELGCSVAKVGHLESGRNVLSKPDLKVIAELYALSPEVHADLEELRLAANTRGWWSRYRLPLWLQNYVGMEADAALVRVFALELIPGLLQTEAYSRELHVLVPHIVAPEEIDRKVAARKKRQERLTADEPLELRTVISEAALHRLRGSECAPEQFRHLVAMAKRPNVTINVLPFSRRLHQSMSGGFVLLDFPEGVSAPAAYFEYAIAGQMEHDAKVVARLSDTFDQLAEDSLGADESAEFIAEWT